VTGHFRSHQTIDFKIWDTRTWELQAEGTNAEFYFEALPDGVHVVQAERGGTLRVSPITASPALIHKDRVHYLGFGLGRLSDGRLVGGAADGGVSRLWDLGDPSRPSPVETPLRFRNAIGFSPDGERVATDAEGLTVWETRWWQPVVSPGIPACQVIRFSPDGNVLFAGRMGGDNRATFMRAPTWQEIAIWEARERKAGARTP
jgi:hypothetical protein